MSSHLRDFESYTGYRRDTHQLGLYLIDSSSRLNAEEKKRPFNITDIVRKVSKNGRNAKVS